MRPFCLFFTPLETRSKNTLMIRLVRYRVSKSIEYLSISDWQSGPVGCWRLCIYNIDKRIYPCRTSGASW